MQAFFEISSNFFGRPVYQPSGHLILCACTEDLIPISSAVSGLDSPYVILSQIWIVIHSGIIIQKHSKHPSDEFAQPLGILESLGICVHHACASFGVVGGGCPPPFWSYAFAICCSK